MTNAANPLAFALNNARKALATTLPTTVTMNELSSSHTCLVLLRALCTSDFTFTYMLLKRSTVLDIACTCTDLLNNELQGETNVSLTADEVVEVKDLLAQLNEYALS